MTHTPGPWIVTPTGVSSMHGPTVTIDANPLKIVANPDWHGNHEEYMANARLIAAAPELLEALIRCKDYLSGPWVAPEDVYEQVNAAISKATGR